MMGRDPATTAEQMRETRLVRGDGELAIGRPAIADQDAGEVGAQDVGSLLEASAGLNAIDGRGRRRNSPERLQHAGDLPPRFIRTHHRTAAHLRTQRLVGGLGLPGGGIDGVDKPLRVTVRPYNCWSSVTILPNERPSCLLSTTTNAMTCAPSCAADRAQRIGGLQRMPALHAPMALAIAAHVHIELTDDHPRDREFFLIVVRDAGLDDRPCARRTLRRQRRLIRLLDRAGHARAGSLSELTRSSVR